MNKWTVCFLLGILLTAPGCPSSKEVKIEPVTEEQLTPEERAQMEKLRALGGGSLPWGAPMKDIVESTNSTQQPQPGQAPQAEQAEQNK